MPWAFFMSLTWSVTRTLHSAQRAVLRDCSIWAGRGAPLRHCTDFVQRGRITECPAPYLTPSEFYSSIAVSSDFVHIISPGWPIRHPDAPWLDGRGHSPHLRPRLCEQTLTHDFSSRRGTTQTKNYPSVGRTKFSLPISY